MKKIIYAVLIIATLLLLLNLDLYEIYDTLLLIDRGLLGLALFCQLLTMLLIAWQWQSLARILDRRPRFLQALKINSRGNIVDSITPGAKVGGELARIYSISQELGLSKGEASIFLGIQKTLSFLSFIVLYGLSLLLLIFERELSLGREIVISSLLVSLLLILGLGFFKFLLPKLKKNSLMAYLSKYSHYLKILSKNKRMLIFQGSLGLLIWLIYPLKLYLIVRGFGLKLGLARIFTLAYISYMVGLIPLLPGSIGSYESSLTLMLISLRIPSQISFSIALSFRFVSFWFEFLVSLLMLGLIGLIYRIKGEDIYGKIQT